MFENMKQKNMGAGQSLWQCYHSTIYLMMLPTGTNKTHNPAQEEKKEEYAKAQT